MYQITEIMEINKPHSIIIQKQVSFGAGPLATNGTPPEVTPDAETK